MNASVDHSTIDRVASELADGPHKHLIGGLWVDSVSRQTFPVFNPADAGQIGEVALGGKDDVDTAVQAARDALNGPWSQLPNAERARLILELATLIERDSEELTALEILDNGKPLREITELEIPRAVHELRQAAGWATKPLGESAWVPGGAGVGYTVRQPVGVAALIVPWNFPFLAEVSKLGPALAAGCTVVLKPAEQTPLSALYLGGLCAKAGFPDGVVNVVTGDATAGAALSEHPDVDKVSFTGSTEVGKKILRAATGNLKRVTLELGGKSPIIIFPDADIEQAVAMAADGIFQTSGQVCVANSRLYAHEAVFEQVVEGVAEVARSLKVGPAIDPETQMGPLISESQLERVCGMIRSGEDEGAQAIVGGTQVDRPGYFVEPTVMVDTKPEMRIMQEEIFGPVIASSSFDSEELDAIAAEANNSMYGLAAYVWTRDLRTAHRMASMLDAGTVSINGGFVDELAFGGFKQSGWGREIGRVGIEAYTELKSVAIAY